LVHFIFLFLCFVSSKCKQSARPKKNKKELTESKSVKSDSFIFALQLRIVDLRSNGEWFFYVLIWHELSEILEDILGRKEENKWVYFKTYFVLYSEHLKTKQWKACLKQLLTIYDSRWAFKSLNVGDLLFRQCKKNKQNAREYESRRKISE